MCDYCGAELGQPKYEKKEHDNLKTLPSDRACKACAEKQERGSIKQGNLISMPTISPMTSLSSSDSSVSSYSELQYSHLYVLHFGQQQFTLSGYVFLTTLMFCSFR